MEELIELYLFNNKQCPLPSVGVLEITGQHAVALYGEGTIEASQPVIKLQESSAPPADFIEFIARQKKISIVEASAILKQYCSHLQQMDAYSETKLPHAGKFYVNADGALVFKSKEIPTAFLPRVSAERVIHPVASHTMVVGDKETTNTEMAAYYSASTDGGRAWWWIWAACLAAIAIGIFVYYFSSNALTPGFGNTQQIDLLPGTKTYNIVE